MFFNNNSIPAFTIKSKTEVYFKQEQNRKIINKDFQIRLNMADSKTSSMILFKFIKIKMNFHIENLINHAGIQSML